MQQNKLENQTNRLRALLTLTCRLIKQFPNYQILCLSQLVLEVVSNLNILGNVSDKILCNSLHE